MTEQLTEEKAAEGAELEAETPDEMESIGHAEHSLPEEDITERTEFAADELGDSEGVTEETEIETESLDDTEAGMDAPDGGKTAVVAEHTTNTEPEPPPSEPSALETGEESWPQATSPESAPEEEPMQNQESDTQPDANPVTQASSQPKTELANEAKTVAQVSTFVMIVAVVVLWLLLH